MSEEQVPPRDQVPEKYTWNAPSLFAAAADWETEWRSVSESLPDIKQFQDRLGDGPQMLLDALEAFDRLLRRVGKVYIYAQLSHAVDTTNQAASKMNSQAQSLLGQTQAAMSFFDPELLSIGEATLRQWLQAEPRLKYVQHYLDNLFRKQAHVRSPEVEELLGLLSDPFAGTSATASMLTNADFKFEPASDADGRSQPVTQSNLIKILAGPDREARRTAWEHVHDTYLAHKNTLATNLATSIKQNVFTMRARRHASTLEATLHHTNIPVEVFHNLIDTFRRNLPTWHRYWKLRRKVLGVETLEPYDARAPLTLADPHVSYEQAVEWICQGLSPMGQDYVEIVRRGCLRDRWVDVMPNQGKRAGAFSSGWPGTHPFIVMSYNHNIQSMSTLAHELGHSLHSYLAWQQQPMLYFDYATFVAEVASNFHQAMVRAYLLEHNPDRNFQINLIEEALGNFQRYFFIMPTLARFEYETHQRVERGQGLTADDLIELMADLFSEGYGSEVHVDRPRVGMTWATFGHLYSDYYVFQYATGISGAHALSKRILAGQPGAVENYLNFLKAGDSVYPLEALRLAGVDLTQSRPVEETFAVLAGMVDRLETLLSH